MFISPSSQTISTRHLPFSYKTQELSDNLILIWADNSMKPQSVVLIMCPTKNALCLFTLSVPELQVQPDNIIVSLAHTTTTAVKVKITSFLWHQEFLVQLNTRQRSKVGFIMSIFNQRATEIFAK